MDQARAPISPGCVGISLEFREKIACYLHRFPTILLYSSQEPFDNCSPFVLLYGIGEAPGISFSKRSCGAEGVGNLGVLTSPCTIIYGGSKVPFRYLCPATCESVRYLPHPLTVGDRRGNLRLPPTTTADCAANHPHIIDERLNAGRFFLAASDMSSPLREGLVAGRYKTPSAQR
jgi:hypothetical protein